MFCRQVRQIVRPTSDLYGFLPGFDAFGTRLISVRAVVDLRWPWASGAQTGTSAVTAVSGRLTVSVATSADTKRGPTRLPSAFEKGVRALFRLRMTPAFGGQDPEPWRLKRGECEPDFGKRSALLLVNSLTESQLCLWLSGLERETVN